jgi:hypothetical protein
VAQEVKHFLASCEALSSTTSIAKQTEETRHH